MSFKKPLVLCILDGWGHRQGGMDNSIFQAYTPNWDDLWAHYPHALLDASGESVGLPNGQMGNSEVGHMTIGLGRVLMQDLPRINKDIEDDLLEDRPAIQKMIATLKKTGGTCHILGLLSPGGIHSHQKHMFALAKIMVQHNIPVVFHVFLDGRDTPPRSAGEYLDQLSEVCSEYPDLIKVGTMCGRYYAMDRDNRWDRIELAYNAMVSPSPLLPHGAGPFQALSHAYADDVSDEFVFPTVLGDYPGMKDGDGLLMANFRSDRARQILRALLDPEFDEFNRKKIVKFSYAAGMVEYSSYLSKLMDVVYPKEEPSNSLGQYISDKKMKQMRIAETEKYAHVTFFLNGGVEKPFTGEDRILVNSPKVATYDMQPEMSAREVTDKVITSIKSGIYDLIVVNYANGDMVGHTGDQLAAEHAVLAIDVSLGRIMEVLESTNGAMLITADHGNVECMQDAKTLSPHTAHTTNPVPIVLFNGPDDVKSLKDGGLQDVAPTVLELLNLEKPVEMTGNSLIIKK